MEAYLEDNRPTLDEICESYEECCKECLAYEFCKTERQKARIRNDKCKKG